VESVPYDRALEFRTNLSTENVGNCTVLFHTCLLRNAAAAAAVFLRMEKYPLRINDLPA
jgi:hypothetical protein